MKTALITGASKGIGRAVCLALAKEGYNIIACARTPDDLELLRKDIEAINGEVQVFAHPCDFANPDQVSMLISWIEREFQTIEVLVNNAGLFVPGSFFEEAPDALAQHMQVNVFAPHALSRSLGKMMRNKGAGHIFNITSVASREVVPTAASYSVTKFALAGLNHILREELKSHRIKVTEIVPGSTLTSSWEGTSVPASEFVLPEDVAKAIVTVLSLGEGANVDEIVIRPVRGQV